MAIPQGNVSVAPMFMCMFERVHTSTFLIMQLLVLAFRVTIRYLH